MDLLIPAFKIDFLFYGKIYTARVEQTFLSDIHERFTVTGGKKSFEILSDRPLLRNTKSRKKIKMQALNVNVAFQQAIESIIQQVLQHIYDIEHPPFDYRDHPKNK